MADIEEDLIYRLRKRAEIRRQISTRKSVQEGAPDRIADLLEEAAAELEHLEKLIDMAFQVYPNLDIDSGWATTEGCPTCGEDGGTSCGDPNCGLLQ